MVLDLAGQLQLAAFQFFWRELVFLEAIGSGGEDHGGERFARRTEVDEVSIALLGEADAEDAAANPGALPGETFDLLDLARRDDRQLGGRRGGRRRGDESDRMSAARRRLAPALV